MADRPINPEDEQVGRKLKGLRVEQGLQLQDVAKRLDMTPGNLAHYESGRNRLSFLDLSRFAGALGVTPVELAQRLGLQLKPSDIPEPLDIAALMAKEFAPVLPTHAETIAKMVESHPELAIRLAQVSDDLEEDDVRFLTQAIEWIQGKHD